jgi:hypothetical protein
MVHKWIKNARDLGLPAKQIGVPWVQIIDIDNYLKKKYNNSDEHEKHLDDNILKLQKTYYNMNQEEKRIEKERRIEEEKRLEVENEKIVNINKSHYKYTPHIEEDNKKLAEKNKNEKKRKKKKIKNKPNKKLNNNEEENLDELIEEFKKIDDKKEESNIKNIINKLNELDRGNMDVIQNDESTKDSNIQQYYYHLKEQIISIDYDEDDEKFDGERFKTILISNILKEKDKIENIRKITKCEKLFFDKKNNYFKILVINEDRYNYKKIINATMLISNMILKIREKIENSKIHFSTAKVALMF